MRIALIRREFSATRGGAERFAVMLARGLVDRGHEVHIVAGMADPNACPGATLHIVPFVRKPSSLKNASFQRGVRQLIANLQCDIVHGLSQVFPQDVYRVGEPLHLHWLITCTPSRIVRLALFFSLRHQVILWLERNIFRAGNYRKIIVNSKLCRQQLVVYYNVPVKNIRLVYNGVDSSLFQPDPTDTLRASNRLRFGLNNNDRVIAFVANDFQRKGLLFAIETIARLYQEGYRVRLLIAGDGSRRYALRLAAASNVADAIVYAGKVSDPWSIYHAADLMLLPSLYDPFANVCLEAMACGVPVITTRCNGASEIIEDGISGVIVDRPQNIDALVHAAARLFDAQKDLRAAMGQAAATRAQQYTPERMVDKTLRVYEEVLREKQNTV
ncbi:MAG: glycosyltransferase family 4 protein [Desulfobacterota bacterium]|nr:glycosyltransferase family 4 protein [Thermodesulfobacteriota bacterium]